MVLTVYLIPSMLLFTAAAATAAATLSVPWQAMCQAGKRLVPYSVPHTHPAGPTDPPPPPPPKPQPTCSKTPASLARCATSVAAAATPASSLAAFSCTLTSLCDVSSSRRLFMWVSLRPPLPSLSSERETLSQS